VVWASRQFDAGKFLSFFAQVAPLDAWAAPPWEEGDKSPTFEKWGYRGTNCNTGGGGTSQVLV